MTLASLARTRVVRAISAFLILISALVLIPGGDTANAAGTPSISLAKSMPGEALAGDPAIPVTLSATNPTGTDGFNLTFVDVLPAGVVFVSGIPAPSQIISNEPSSGQTTLVWGNVADLQAGVTESISYTVTHNGALGVGDSFTNRASAYVSQDPRVVPTYDAGIDGISNPTAFGRAENVSATTDLLPFILTKTEPNAEGELLRGLHDHQTVYTLTIENNHLGATSNFAIEDWIPAGMEFLSCGTTDNSSSEEYAGSGAINAVGNAPDMDNPCIEPDIVETVSVNPPGPLGLGIYTHVVWTTPTLATSLPTSGIARFDYIAAIPLRANTLDWPGDVVPPTDGPQVSNIDNNTGASTNETATEQQMTNGARATGTYTGDSVTYTDFDEMTVSAEDLSIHKKTNNEVITHGADSGWTLFVETSEYTGTASGLVVADTVPDGLCPNGAGSANCPGGTGPSPAYTSATENSNGTWTLVWNLPNMTTSDDATITFSTTTLSHYQEGFADDKPVVANDAWTNSVHISGDVDGRAVEDVSSAGQSAAPVSIIKEVSDRQDPLVSCTAVPGGDWNPTLASGYHIGDRVCWRLGVDFPVDLDTFDSDVQDYLPPGHTYTADDSWDFGANNSVPSGDVAGPDAGDIGETVLTWTVGDGGGYVAENLYFEVVFSSTITDPDATTSGTIVENLMKYSYENSAGTPFNQRDLADIEVVEAELDLVKGVIAKNTVSTGGGNNVDGVEVMQGDVVTYQLTITNSGDLAANDVEVWDLLPSQYDACSSKVSAISDGGACAAARRLEWTGLSVPAGGSTTMTYDVTFPIGIAPDAYVENNAGVRSYTSATNHGSGVFTYFPASNIDTTAPTANTTVADDPSSVITKAASINKSRTTAVTETWNTADQATIGETITYTVEVVIPHGTTVYAATLTDDLSQWLDLISSSHTFAGVGGNGGVVRTEDAGTDTVTVTFADPYTNPPGSGDDTLTLTIDARVLDVPQSFNGEQIPNTANFAYRDTATSPSPTTLSASVDTPIVEPQIGIGKTSADSIGNDNLVVGGETVDYTVTVSNSGSVAHDVVVVDTLPEGMTPSEPIPDSGNWVADATPGDGVGGTITWNLTSVARGTPVALNYSVTIDNPVVVSSAFTNNVVVDATSMAGTPPQERTAGTRYRATASDTQNSPLASIAKSVAPTTATLGEIATYTIDVTIPPGTIMYDATVLDTLPAEMAYLGNMTSSCSACSPSITVTEMAAVGSDIGFWLNDIGTASASARVVTISYDAYVSVASAGVGDTPDNSASVYGNRTDILGAAPPATVDPSSFEVAVGPAVATITVVEPSLTIDKDVAGQSGDLDYRRARPGETLTYTVTVINSSAANVSAAHDITIEDTLADPGLVTVSNISGGGTFSIDTITWTVPGPLARGASVSFTYDVTIDTPLGVGSEVDPGAELVNTADVPTYYGVSTADRAANPEFKEYTDVVHDIVAIELDLASIGNYVWFDADDDGVQDSYPPDVPMAGIDLTITYLGLDGAVGGGDDEVHLVTTDSFGAYLVDELPGGQYTVEVDPASLPPGMAVSWDRDGGDDNLWTGSLGEAADREDVDFGYTGTGSIGDIVWYDRDGDGGDIEAGEFGLDEVEVTVTWLGFDSSVGGGDDVAYTTTTDANGEYLVSSLPAGTYTVAVNPATLPGGMSQTFDEDGVGSPDVSTDVLSAGEINKDQDFGYTGDGSIGDFIWLDTDNDGAIDAGEPGIPGIPVELIWAGEDDVLGNGDDHLFTTTTDGGGGYLFPNLPQGRYQVDVVGGLPLAATNTYDEDGGTDSSTIVNLGDGEVHQTADFGYHGSASIGDTVWWDIDGDTVKDVSEPGFAGVTVQLTYFGGDGAVGGSDDLVLTTITDADGHYVFSDLPVGNYEVAVIGGIPAGFDPTCDESGPIDETSTIVGLGVAEFHLTADFGYRGSGSIGDLVFLDSNGDGVLDPGEPGIPGVDVELIWHGLDGVPGTPDDVTLSTTTDTDGFYVFEFLPPGNYDVVVDSSSLPAGVTATGDADGIGTPHTSALALGIGEADLDQDFGYRGGASIGDTIWFDRNGSGVVDDDEYGLAGVDISVTWAGPDGDVGTAGDNEIFVATTDSDGNYLVTNLPAGEYLVVVDAATLPAGMSQVFDPDADDPVVMDNQTTVTLSENESHPDADFGYRGSGSIGDRVWLDLNGDGDDTGEPGIPNQAIELTWAGQVYTTVTDANGFYLFENLPPGVYDIVVIGPIVGAAANTDDEDGDLDSHTTVTLGDGVDHDTADFGYMGSAVIGDLVWLDLNGNGNGDIDEPGLDGVEVTVIWYGDDGVPGGGDDVALPVYTTDPAGNYLATGLPAGEYGVAITSGIPAGLVNSADEDADLDGQTDVAGLAAGSSHLTADFGYTGAGTIGDTIWWDLDGDMAQGVDEPGLSGIDVTLTWAGLDGVFGSGDDAIFTATTDSDGMYVFEYLAPGDYQVVVDETGLPLGVTQSADPDATADGQSALTLGLGEANLDQDFGYRGDGSVGDLVWYDIDNDGVPDLDEPGVAGVQIIVTYLGSDGVSGGGDDVDFRTVTNSTGSYHVPGLPSGFYTVSVDESTVTTGLTVAGDLDGGDPVVTVFTLGAAEDKTDVDYPVIGDASLSGTVWNDGDGDQVIGTIEPGIRGVTVIVTWDGPAGPVVIPVVSGADGSWELPTLPPGNYTIELDLTSVPDDMTPTTRTDATVTLPVGGHENIDFGLAEIVDLGSTVWIDTDGDGVVDPDEDGVPNVLVNLYDETGLLIAITETDANGNYLFTDLAPGTYLVSLDPDSLPAEIRATFDRDGSPDLNTLVHLTIGNDILDANFGFQVGLPVTGIDVAGLTMFGAAFLLLGIALVGSVRIRRGQPARR